MKLIGCDFETRYDRDYSLSKLTTEEYLRDPRFEVIGVSVKVDDAPAAWFSGTMEETKNWLQQFDWAGAMLVAHNTMFDGAILSWHFDIHPKVLADTLSMARATHGINVGGSLKALAEHYEIGVKGDEVVRALGMRRLDFTPEELAQYGRYCVNDTELTVKLFHILVADYPLDELRLIDLTLRMFTEPTLELDSFLLEQHLSEVRAAKEELLNRLGGDIEVVKKKIMSNPMFADLLREQGVEPPMKISLTTKKPTFAFAKTDEGLKELAKHENPLVQTLVAVRLGVKSTIEETRTERFLGIAQRGSLPVPLKYYGAPTARWAGMDKVNLQNLTARGEHGGKLKSAIRAPEGYALIDCDSSQIEARVLAWLAGQNDLVEAFRNKEDVYRIMAASIYNKGTDQIDADERFVGKTTILGCGYGMGGAKFQSALKQKRVDVTLDMSNHIIRTYRQRYPKIPELWDQGDRCLGALVDDQGADFGEHGVIRAAWGVVSTPGRIPLQYKNLHRHTKPDGNVEFIYTSRTGTTGIWGGKFTENICQHLARLIVAKQMLKIAKRLHVVLMVHDAVAALAQREKVARARMYVEECMRWVPDWAVGLPLDCESGIGDNLGEC